MSIAIYLRVSTDRQTVSNQQPDIYALAKRRGLAIERTYQEQESAAKRRPQLDRMLADAARGLFDTLIVWSIDRLGRDLAGNLDMVRRLDRSGVTVISVREPWLDTGGPARELLVAIFSWVAQFERRRLIERTRAGLDRARSEGIRLGRPKASALKLEFASALVASGVSVEDAAKQAGLSASTLWRHRSSLRKGQPNRPVAMPSDGVPVAA